MRRWSLLILAEGDDVATALADLAAGEAPARIGDRIETVTLTAPVPLGHKVARRAIARGAVIRKYGAPIGEATEDIAAGAHVHVHNLRSLRARK
jgi:(2R)-sulfolactate sulfo-lyase subunit alpha